MKTWIFENREYTDIDRLLDEVFDSERFNDPEIVDTDCYLEENYDNFTICGCEFSPAEILKNMDRYLYDQVTEDLADSRADDLKYQYKETIEDAGNNEEIYIEEIDEKVYVVIPEEEDDEDEDEVEEAELEKEIKKNKEESYQNLVRIFSGDDPEGEQKAI